MFAPNTRSEAIPSSPEWSVMSATARIHSVLDDHRTPSVMRAMPSRASRYAPNSTHV